MFPGTGRCKAALGYEISRVTVSQENRMMLLISDPLCKVICSLLTCNFKHLFLYRITAALRYCFQNPLHCSRGEKAPPVNLHFTALNTAALILCVALCSGRDVLLRIHLSPQIPWHQKVSPCWGEVAFEQRWPCHTVCKHISVINTHGHELLIISRPQRLSL